jgi:hypothetical protein
MIYLFGGLIIGGIIIYVFVKTAKEVDTEMEEEIQAAKNEPSFYERMQMWKYGNKVINGCFQIESE